MSEEVATLCLNCHAALTGPWCANCGQKHEPEIHTFAHFASEAFENITHADSRLWRTLWVLISRPGLLTREFFGGRRMRYLPPVRFYLVVSLVFFLLAGAFGDRHDPLLQVDAADKSSPGGARTADPAKYCDDLKYSGPYQDKVQALLPVQCRRIMADNGRSLSRAFIQNAPRALFVVLPLLAGFMMLLYWRPRRYYVEHLLLLLHNHIFLFIGYGLLILLGLALPDSGFVSLCIFLFHLYVAWYFYRGLRVVYAQGRALSLAKFSLLGLVYVVTAMLALLLTMLFSAITV